MNMKHIISVRKKEKNIFIPNRMNLSEDMDKWIKRKENNAYRRFHYLNTSGYKTLYSAHT